MHEPAWGMHAQEPVCMLLQLQLLLPRCTYSTGTRDTTPSGKKMITQPSLLLSAAARRDMMLAPARRDDRRSSLGERTIRQPADGIQGSGPAAELALPRSGGWRRFLRGARAGRGQPLGHARAGESSTFSQRIATQ
jgi:hypothetical protein